MLVSRQNRSSRCRLGRAARPIRRTKISTARAVVSKRDQASKRCQSWSSVSFTAFVAETYQQSCRTPQSGVPPVRASRQLCPLTFLQNGDRGATHDQEHHRDQGDRPKRHHAEIQLVLI